MQPKQNKQKQLAKGASRKKAYGDPKHKGLSEGRDERETPAGWMGENVEEAVNFLHVLP